MPTDQSGSPVRGFPTSNNTTSAGISVPDQERLCIFHSFADRQGGLIYSPYCCLQLKPVIELSIPYKKSKEIS